MRRLPHPVTPARRQPPCSVGQHVCPSPPDDRVACASSRVPYRLPRRPHWPMGDSRGLRLARPRRVPPADHGPRGAPTRRGRRPLDTGRVNGASACRSNALTCPPGRCGAGAAWWLAPRPRHEAYHRGFRGLLRTDSFPTVTPWATPSVTLYRVLDTSPWPATHPRCGNRWHHTRLDHSFSVSSSKTRDLVSQ